MPVFCARAGCPAAMKQIIASRTVDIPEGITMEVKARKVRVKGPRGAAQHLGISSGSWLVLHCTSAVLWLQQRSEAPS